MRQQGISAAPASPVPGSQAVSAALSIRIECRTLDMMSCQWKRTNSRKDGDEHDELLSDQHDLNEEIFKAK